MSRPALSLEGRTAVITGAGSGIGRALAMAAARRGMTVALCDLDEAGLAETARQIETLGQRAFPQAVDVTNGMAIDAFAMQVQQHCPPVALLFANAGILRQGSIIDIPPSHLRLLFEVNVVGTIQTIQAFLPLMLETGTPGQIVITASTGAMASYPHLSGYCATKHALWPIAEGLRADMAENHPRIGVSMLMPGPVSTAIFDKADPDRPTPPDSISPDEAAAIAFDGAMTDRFMILTHPSFIERARERFDATLASMAGD
ncbi:hypothetical protein MB02_07480 [Croceicoccus estronivorus]|uniref:SDR family NAD(P)-dependent oxidoreductase n=1 Tax=Croceicoccus estronivorus TaxID=1172626 RepID=UPI00082F54A3|nr:SDR family NAD(P)-dependent oxidoreductase [Croceicoccus estronivorus]OCC24412.1 hypothetical protein MB02_07480 [Croceicoccus estronivorus]